MSQLEKYLDAVADSFCLNKSDFKEKFFNLFKEYEISENFISEDLEAILNELLNDISVYNTDITTGLFCFKCDDNEYELNIFTDNAIKEIETLEEQIARGNELSYQNRWFDNDLPSWVDRRGL